MTRYPHKDMTPEQFKEHVQKTADNYQPALNTDAMHAARVALRQTEDAIKAFMHWAYTHRGLALGDDVDLLSLPEVDTCIADYISDLSVMMLRRWNEEM